MRDSWQKLAGCVLRPTRARARLERCQGERERHLASRRAFAADRSRALATCRARIEAARAEVFAADDGVVTSLMTNLEREWRVLSRPDPDAGLMDLWARIAPRAWIDRKRWRDAEPSARLDVAIALACDVEGVEAAEAAIDALRTTLAEWDTPIRARIRWRAFGSDVDCTSTLLAKPLDAAFSELASRGLLPVAIDRARCLENEVQEAMLARLPERAVLARALAHAAFVDAVWRAASLPRRANPVTPLVAVWKAGYAIAAIDASGVTIELPGL